MGSLRLVALVSGVYDLVLGIAFLAAADRIASLFGVPPPQPAVLGDTTGLFLVCIGLGYWLPWRDPTKWRAYLWVMGPALKGGGAVIFLRDFWLRRSPAAFVMFAITDGALALWTFVALMRTRAPARQARS